MIRRYTNAETDFLIENSPKMTVREIASILGRSIGSVNQKQRELGLSSAGYLPQREIKDILREISREVFAEVGIYWRSLA
jgi:hypothetical protein